MSTQTLTVLLADLVGSSAHVTTIPQEQAVDYLQDAILPIRQEVEQHGGTIVKFTGDGYLATFTCVGQALRAADRIRQHFMRQKHTPTGISLDGVRVVLNTADVTVEDNDIIGDGVALVARLEKNVPTNQVYLTRAVYEIADDAEFAFEQVGEMSPRGWHRPVIVYQLISAEASIIESGVFLLITDLHGLITYGENLPASTMHQWLQIWGDLHREAVRGLQGRVRQFIADMALITFTTADDAVQGLLGLRALAAIHNEKHTELPPIHFKAALSCGDLILSPTGVVGRGVNQTFDLLNATPRGTVWISRPAHDQLDVYRDRFQPVTLTTLEGTPGESAYQLIEPNPTGEQA
jgi:class 3 adenylate cyclase